MVSAQVSAGSGQMRESFWKSAVIPTSLRGSQQWGPCGSAAFQGGGGEVDGEGGRGGRGGEQFKHRSLELYFVLLCDGWAFECFGRATVL